LTLAWRAWMTDPRQFNVLKSVVALAVKPSGQAAV
jgi:hypothetical protein